MKKGFIFSMTAIFFVALVIMFFSLYLFVYNKPAYTEKINNYGQNIIKFINGQSNETSSSETKWCTVHLVYDPDQDSASQSTIEKKEYCEGYGTKRFI